MSAATRIVGERHLLPSRMAVNVAFACNSAPPPVLCIALNMHGHGIATAPMPFAQWHWQYITRLKIDRQPSAELKALLDSMPG